MEVTQIILIVFIVVLIIMYPVMMYSRNKKENLRMQEQTNSLKIGDKVLTTNGIYGTIISIRDEFDRKVVTIETGDENNTGYVSIDAFAIYKIFDDGTVDGTQQGQEVGTSEEKTEENQNEEQENISNEHEESESNEEKKNEASEDSENVTSPDDNDTDDAPKSEE